MSACYEAWNELRDELERYYKDKPRARLPLSQQKEFRAIKNMIIHEAESIRLGVFTFEDADDHEEMDEPQAFQGGEILSLCRSICASESCNVVRESAILNKTR